MHETLRKEIKKLEWAVNNDTFSEDEKKKNQNPWFKCLDRAVVKLSAQS